ncbi:MAG: M16 family metallopeptidase [Gammaproteobacteria bacterium]
MRLLSSLAALVLAVSSAVAAPPARAAAPAATPDIPFERFRLDNGLTVVVHTDRKAPIVAVNVWYHVGGKDEPADRQEFAHWFEHLMFQGSENYRDEFFKPFEEVGATDQNGTTSADRTNYFQNVPTTALDRALWMESDRMGHLLGALDQKVLDEQRGVVRNEKRQRENQPYGKIWDRLFEASFPQGHPYHAPDVAADKLLEGATLEEAKDWFRRYYGAANATLVLAGDIDVATAREKAQKYFGHIAPGRPLTRHQVDIAARGDSRRDVMYDRVPQAMLIRSWNVPPVTHADNDLLGLVSQVLGGSAASRLDARLVHRDQSADNVGTFNEAMEIAGLFAVQVMVKAGQDPAAVEKAMDEELARLLQQGPTKQELDRARTALRAGFVRGIERIGGFGGKSDVLAECQVFHGDPGCFRRSLAAIESATPAQVRDVARRWLGQGDYTLTVLPFGALRKAPTSAVDRSLGVPKVAAVPDLSFPALERFTLSNGVPVVLARRPEVPVVQVQAMFDAGFAADAGRKTGTAAFAMAMMGEGAGPYGALDFAARAEDLGATVGASAALDASTATLSALKDRLDPSLALFATMLREPRLDAAEIERVRKQWLSRIAREKSQPNSIAQRLLPPLMYGTGHPYGIPFTGSGTEASVQSLTRTDLTDHLAAWVRPDNMRLVVVGDTTPEAIRPLLEKHLGSWRATNATRGTKTVPEVALPARPRVFLVDRPDAEQAFILAGHPIPSSRSPQALETDSAITVIGGLFSSRLNMNLREDKGWSYGSYALSNPARYQRPMLVFAPVQTDRAVDSLKELKREFEEYVSTRPATAAEVSNVIANDVRGLPGSFETAAAVRSAVGGILLYDRPDDWVRTLKARTEAQSVDSINAAARAVIQPSAMTWVVVGDLAKIEQGIRALGLGEVQVVDLDGKPVR